MPTSSRSPSGPFALRAVGQGGASSGGQAAGPRGLVRRGTHVHVAL
ncbi:hypothetical protein MUG94_07365 [Arthrobacter gengyunqii]|uniref:Uncharacterized protein n=1 Tax=Arthrobacter gengyunqii TaxID=2886940 RepID=A0A9X1M342_9MICC|nr:hypothetical protein [Arthrobacter gengyunqii]MCC3270351.1 hypothetical protein [Arthrobacter gengyunqii]UOY97544.1 hypothetical protein MUG94_07365 [Arthrobacter gengyunqii]